MTEKKRQLIILNKFSSLQNDNFSTTVFGLKYFIKYYVYLIFIENAKIY